MARYPLGMAALATSEDSTVTTNSSGSEAMQQQQQQIPTTSTARDSLIPEHDESGFVATSPSGSSTKPPRSPAARFRQLFARNRTTPGRSTSPSADASVVVAGSGSHSHRMKGVRSADSAGTRGSSFSRSGGSETTPTTDPPSDHHHHQHNPHHHHHQQTTIQITTTSTSPTTSPRARDKSKRDWHFFPFFSSKVGGGGSSKRDQQHRISSESVSRDSEVTPGTQPTTAATGTRRRLGIPTLTIREASMDEADETTDHGVVPQPHATGASAATSQSVDVTAAEPSIKQAQRPSLVAESSSRLGSVDSGYHQQAPKMSTGSASGRFMWKLKPKATSTQSASSQSSDSAWKSSESCQYMMWRSAEGGQYELKGTRLEYLTQFERSALQKIALHRLQKANLNCNVVKPKDAIQFNAKHKRQKQFKGQRANTVTVVDKKLPVPANQQVFGIPIQQCIANDQKNLTPADADLLRCKSLDEPLEVNMAAACALQPAATSGSRLSVPKLSLTPRLSQSSIRSSHSDDDRAAGAAQPAAPRSPMTRSASPGGLNWMTTRQSSTQSQVSNASNEGSVHAGGYASSNENLLGPHSSPSKMAAEHKTSSLSIASQSDGAPVRNPQVPKIVETCTDYLKKHVQTVGLFRKPGNVQRCRKLRVELDSGQEVIVTDGDDDEGDIRPHDIAALLKEYFRDLPHPLMTSEMYDVCVALGHSALQDRLTEDQCLELVGYVIATLPPANSDTLLVLLRFLEEVANAADDEIGPDGKTIKSGNKMNANNLATIFAPSIIRPADTGKTPFATDLGDNDAVIRVVEMMINNVDLIFTIPRELQAAVYRELHESEPEQFDNLLYKLYQQFTVPNLDESCGGSAGVGAGGGTLFCETLREDTGAPEVSRDPIDGSTIVKYRTEVTHRIVYRAPQQRFDLDTMLAGCAAATDVTADRLERTGSVARKCQSEGELEAMQHPPDQPSGSGGQQQQSSSGGGLKTGGSPVINANTAYHTKLYFSSDPSKLHRRSDPQPATALPGSSHECQQHSTSTEGRASDVHLPSGGGGQATAGAATVNTASEVSQLPSGGGESLVNKQQQQQQRTALRQGSKNRGKSAGGGGSSTHRASSHDQPPHSSRRSRFFGHIGDVFSKTFVK